MSSNVKVSIIIPIYNVESYISQCLSSILGQTLSNLELICVDDASTDNSAKIIAEFINSDCRIKYISHTINKGPSHARITGLKEAIGEYILFVDADDTIEKYTLERLVNKADRTNADITIMGIKHLFCDGKFTLIYSKPQNIFCKEIIDKQELMTIYYPQLLTKNGFPCNIFDKLYKKEILIPNIPNVYSNYVAEDLIFNAEVFPRAQKVSWIEYSGYNWRYSGGERKYLIKHWEELKSVYQSLFNIVNSLKLTTEQLNKAYDAIAFSRLNDLRNSVIQRILTGESNITDFLDIELSDITFRQHIKFYIDKTEPLYIAAIDKDIKKFLTLSKRYMSKHWKLHTFMLIINFITKILKK